MLTCKQLKQPLERSYKLSIEDNEQDSRRSGEFREYEEACPCQTEALRNGLCSYCNGKGFSKFLVLDFEATISEEDLMDILLPARVDLEQGRCNPFRVGQSRKQNVMEVIQTAQKRRKELIWS